VKRISMIAPLLVLPCVLIAQQAKVLYVHDDANDNNRPYIAAFKAAFEAQGIAYAEAEAPSVKDVAGYDLIVVHGIVQAFNSKSPVRDWLKTKPALGGKKSRLFVTANRWFLKNLFKDLNGLLEKDGAEIVDSVSMATKEMDAPQKEAAVRAFVKKIP
jgi:hypothetical protein